MTASDTVLISVVIPAYNYAKTLRRAVESVLPQLDKCSELIIIDDGSTDETPQVIAALAGEFPGKFRAIRQPNAGLAAVRNIGIEEAKGRYLIFLDADDEMCTDSLFLLKQHISRYPATQFVIGGHISVFPNGTESRKLPDYLPETPLGRVRAYLLDKTLCLSNGACAMDRAVFELGTYPERFRNAEDIPVFAQVLAGYQCSILNAPMARIYKHDDSLRHNLKYGMQIGDQLVAEVFDLGRLPLSMQVLRRAFLAQRYLSLFRTCAAAGEREIGLKFYVLALKTDWRAIFRFSYTRKVLKLFLGFAK
jgi:glycosyltransferase involved in cell wall biosynthesis